MSKQTRIGLGVFLAVLLVDEAVNGFVRGQWLPPDLGFFLLVAFLFLWDDRRHRRSVPPAPWGRRDGGERPGG